MNKLTLILSALLVVAGCSRPASEQSEQGAHPAAESNSDQDHKGEAEKTLRIKPEMLRDLKVTTAEVEVRPAGEGSMFFGELRVNENAYAEIGAPVSSRVLTVQAGVSDSVQTGDPLATLQSTELGKARADFVTAQARVELAETTLARKRRLAAERIVAQREVQESEAGLAEARAQVRAARASIRALGAGLDESTDSSEFTLRSPVSGTVIERNAVRGHMADADQVLFRVGDLSELWLTVHAFERDAVRIRPGSQVRIVFPALPGTSFSGKVDLVGRQVDPQSRTVPVRVVVANRSGQLRPGMSATAWVNPGGDESVAIAVPAASVQRLADEWVVFIPQQHRGEFEVRPIGRGRDLGGEIEVLSGLKRGEKVVVDGAFLLKAEAEKARGEGEEHGHD